ncbi:MAG: hypothetical protein R2705_24540 [Ilumatobacteraceae bacterium]
MADAHGGAERPHRRRVRRELHRPTRTAHPRLGPGDRRIRHCVGRFAAYQHRLTAATARTKAGETKMFTGVMCNSFHDI